MTATTPSRPADARPPSGRGPWRWLDDRLGISGLRYPVPAHANSVAYTLGGMTLVSFVGLVLTGIYLAQFYDPRPEFGHSSVFYITDKAFAGALARGLHYWLASAFVLTLALHLIRTFVTAAYKAPREMTWVTGVLLLGLGLGLLYTGTILKLDQEAVEALEHNNELAALLGGLGFWFTPEFADNVAQTTRLYVAHISILPLLLAVLIAVHMLLIKRHRIAPLPWGSAEEVAAREREEHAEPFTRHLAHIGKWGLVVLGVCLVLVALVPVQLGAAGITGIEITKPPWYFMWLYPLENWFGLDPLWIVPGLLTLGLLAVPFVDRSRERDPRRRPVWIAVGALALLAWLLLTIYGAVTEPATHVG